MNDVAVETQAKNQIVEHVKAHWVGWATAVLVVLVGSYTTTFVRNIADVQIKASGGVTQLELQTLKTELEAVKGELLSTNTLSVETNERLDATVSRLDQMIVILSSRNN